MTARLLDLVEFLRARPLVIVARWKYDEMPARKLHFFTTDAVAGHVTVVERIEAPTLGDGYTKFLRGDWPISSKFARADFALWCVPPRQSFGVSIEPWQREAAGVLLLHGWSVPAREWPKTFPHGWAASE